MFKEYFNTNLKRYNFLNFVYSVFAMLCMLQFGVFIATKNYLNFAFAIFDLLLTFILGIYADKYFKITYQLKKNAKKEISKQNNN